MKQRGRGADTNDPGHGEQAHSQEESPMHEQERPRSPGEQEEKPARNHPVPGLDQRQHDHPTDDFEEGAQPQRCIHQGYAILR